MERLSSRTVLAIAVWITWLAVACSAPDRPAAFDELLAAELAGRDVIIVLSDTHRLDHVAGLHADARGLTPNLAAFTAAGFAFPGALTPVPISAPAYATLMTGLLPTEHGLLNNEQDLAQGLPLLQERLQDAGYLTAAVLGNPFCSGGHGFARGFDRYWDSVEGRGNHGEVITDEAIRLLDGIDDETPVFLFLSYMDAHTPYIADEIPPSLRVTLGGGTTLDLRADNTHVEQRIPLTLAPGRNAVGLSFLDEGSPAIPADAESPLYIRDLRLASGRSFDATVGITEVPDTGFRHLANSAELAVVNPGRETVRDELVFRCYRLYRHDNIPRFYRAGVRSFDRSFGRLVDELRLRGRWDDAVVVFVSDHGEMLGEHDAWGHVGHLYQECLRIPLVIKAPGVEGGRTDDRRIGLRDLHDLVLELALGADSDRRAEMAARASEPLIAATYPPEGGRLKLAAIDGRRKVAVDETGARHAFDLIADPHEQRDLVAAGSADEAFEALLGIASAELASAADVESLDLATLTDDERDRLRALGYLHGSP